MAVKTWLLDLPEGARTRNGVASALVQGDSSAIAKRAAAAYFEEDGNWEGADAIDVFTSAYAADLEGYLYEIKIGRHPDEGSPADFSDLVVVRYTAVENDTADLVGAALVTALNATAEIAGAAYNTGSNVLTIAETSDDLGDHTIQVNIYPPGGSRPMNSLRTTLVHQGAHGAALKCTLVQPTAVPAVKASR